MENNDLYFQEIAYLRGLPWRSESIEVLSGQIYTRISVSKNPVLIGMSFIFILLKLFRDEGHSDDLRYKYDVVAGYVIKGFDF